MKTTKILATLGFSLIILGLSLSYFNSKVDQPIEIQPISNERNCAISVLYFEARNTSVKERQAVLDVVINRTKHKNYPSTICGVVQQPRQFSYLNNPNQNAKLLPEFETLNTIDRKAYLEIEQIVDYRLFSGKVQNNKILPKNALHYHLKIMDKLPNWSTSTNKIIVKGLDRGFKHVYYIYIG